METAWQFIHKDCLQYYSDKRKRMLIKERSTKAVESRWGSGKTQFLYKKYKHN